MDNGNPKTIFFLQVFTNVTVQLQPHVTQLLDQNASHLDNLQFDVELEVTFDADSMNYLMAGNWYQVECARAYLDAACAKAGLKPEEERDNQGQEKSENEVTEKADSALRISSCSVSSDEEEFVQGTNDKSTVNNLFTEDNTNTTNTHTSGLGESNIKWRPPNLKDNIYPRLVYPAHANIDESHTCINNLSPTDYGSQSIGGSSQNEAWMSRYSDAPRTVPTSYSTCERAPSPPHCGFHIEGQGPRSLPGVFPDYDSDEEPPFDSYPNHEMMPHHYMHGAHHHGVHQCDQHGAYMPHDPRHLGASLSRSDIEETSLSLDLNIGPLDIKVKMGDLLKQTSDAIVSPASTDLANQYGVAAIIARAAGPDSRKECREYIESHGSLCIGDVIHTSAGGMLDKHVGFILHAAGPTWREDEAEQTTHLLTCTYLNCFQYADKRLWLKSISLPLISTGMFKFNNLSTKIYKDTYL